jgi:ketosteroid isomerase-like protein
MESRRAGGATGCSIAPVYLRPTLWACAIPVAVAALASPRLDASLETDGVEVARLDTEFQRAVKRNDAETMTRILHEVMVLILGDGRVNPRAEQLAEARNKIITYEIQDEDPGTQTVRVHRDTAIVAARLRIRGRQDFRQATVVQRYLCAHSFGMAVFLWASLASPPREPRFALTCM